MPDPLDAFLRAAWPEWATYTERMQVSLRAAVERGLAAYEAAQWQPIETAPRDDRWAIIYEGFERVRTAWWSVESGRWIVFARGDALLVAPTYWRPIPQPPGDAP